MLGFSRLCDQLFYRVSSSTHPRRAVVGLLHRELYSHDDELETLRIHSPHDDELVIDVAEQVQIGNHQAERTLQGDTICLFIN